MKKLFLFIVIIAILGVTVYFVFLRQTEEESNNEISETNDTQEDQTVSDDTEMGISGYIDVSPEEAQALINQNPDIVIIDVSPSYDEGHLPDAVNYYIGDGSLDEAIQDLEPDATYLVYCHVDSAAISGAQALVDAGFTNVYRLEGNYSAWVDAGYEVEK